MAIVKPMEALDMEAVEVVDLAAEVDLVVVPEMVEVLEGDVQEVAEVEEVVVVVVSGVELVEALEEISENNLVIRFANPHGIHTTSFHLRNHFITPIQTF